MADQRIPELAPVTVPALTDRTNVRQAGDTRDKYETIAQILSLVVPAPEVNDLSAAVTWVNVPDLNITQSSVVQHEAALTIVEGQITGAAFANWNTAFSWGDHALAGYLTSEVNDLSVSVTWANIPDANVPVTAVTQHVASIDHDSLLNFAANEHFTQAAISIPASQISDFDTEVGNNPDVAANTAKVTNATHTGEVTGSGALAAAPAIISNKAVVTAVATDKVLLLDATDGLLKAADVTDFIGAAAVVFPEYLFYGDQFENPNNADWEINALAPAAADSNNAGLTVRLFDDASAEGVGMSFRLPSAATSLSFEMVSRAETAPGGAVTVSPRIHVRTIGDNVAVPSPPITQIGMTAIDIPTNENFQYDSQAFTFASLALTAGTYVQFEFSRNPTHPSDDLVGDWAVLSIRVSFT